jgi:hypothetical protein
MSVLAQWQALQHSDKEPPTSIDGMTMKPNKSILQESFTYTPSTATAVDATWRKYGWTPMTEQERLNRRRLRAGASEVRIFDLQVVRSA